MMSFYAVALMLILVFVYRIRHVGRFGVHQLYFVVILCLVRLAFPVEFGFTKDVAFREFYNLMVPFLFERYVGPLCIADWLGIIWGVVAVVLLVRSAVKNKSFKNSVLQEAMPAGDKFETKR